MTDTRRTAHAASSILTGNALWLVLARTYLVLLFLTLLTLNHIPWGLSFYALLPSLLPSILYVQVSETAASLALLGLPLVFAILMHIPRLFRRPPVIQRWPLVLFVLVWLLNMLYLADGFSAALAHDGWLYMTIVVLLELGAVAVAISNWMLARRAPESIAAGVYRYAAIGWLFYLAFPTIN